MVSMTVGRKRRASELHSNGLAMTKKAKISANTEPTSLGRINNDMNDYHDNTYIPSKISATGRLPTLRQRQPATLSDDEYQNIDASTVLKASLDRSRYQWTNEGVLDRYWVKPETGKHAKPAPANNPDVKTMKAKGPCRIRIEPHIFEAELFIDEKNKPKIQPVTPSISRAYLQSIPPGHAHPHRFHRAQTISSQQPTTGLQSCAPVHGGAVGPSTTRSSIRAENPESSILTHTSLRAQSTVHAPSPSSPKPKQSPDPVISMLAERASINQDLKLLMKEVATGRASQEQLRIFQRHIDELTKIIQDRERQRKEQETEERRKAAETKLIPQLDGADDIGHTEAVSNTNSRSHTPVTHAPYQFQQQWTPQPVVLPVVLQFTTPGSTDDRFLFPQYSVLESLSKQHTLASFIVTRPADTSNIPCDGESPRQIWQSVTIMVEVAYGREELLNHIKRWVKPLNEVREHMQRIIEQSSRAPDDHLAFRLPLFSNSTAQGPKEIPNPSIEAQNTVDGKGYPRKGLPRSGTQAETDKVRSPMTSERSNDQDNNTEFISGRNVLGRDAVTDRSRSSRRSTRHRESLQI